MSKEILKKIIDVVDERELDTVFKILIRFIQEDAILPDEAESYIASRHDWRNGDVYSHAEVWE